MKNLLKKDSIIRTLLVVIILLILANASIVYYVGSSIKHNDRLKRETDQIKVYTNSILYDVIHGADLAVRG